MAESHHIIVSLHYSLQPEHIAMMSQKTRGYLIKFDEYIQGAKTSGRRKRSNWQRFWAVLDGSTLLFYRDEEVGHLQCLVKEAIMLR